MLLFVQFEDLMKKVSEALDFRGIDHLQITGSASKKSNALEQFQNNAHARVLLLNVIDESASGAYVPLLIFPADNIAISRMPITPSSYLHYWPYLSKRTMRGRLKPLVGSDDMVKRNMFISIGS